MWGPWVWVWCVIYSSRVARLGCDTIGQAMEAMRDFPDLHFLCLNDRFGETVDFGRQHISHYRSFDRISGRQPPFSGAFHALSCLDSSSGLSVYRATKISPAKNCTGMTARTACGG